MPNDSVAFQARRAVLALVAAVLLTGLVSCLVVENWVGGFRQAEFRVRFIRTDGKPVKGVTLAVKDHSGNDSPCYPITDYHFDAVPVSDNDGVMTFHHVCLGPEYSGKIRHLFFVFSVGDMTPPVYKCNFVLSEKLVDSVIFHDYFGLNRSSHEWNQLPKTKISLRMMNVTCDTPTVPDYLKVQNKTFDKDEQVFPIVERTIVVQQ